MKLSTGDLYELKACVNMAHANLEESEYKNFLLDLENKINILFLQEKEKSKNG